MEDVVVVTKLAMLQEVLDGRVTNKTLTFIWGDFFKLSLLCVMLQVLLDELGTFALSALQRCLDVR
jgi:hypothetical protein